MKTFDQCKDEVFKGWWFGASEEVNELYRQAAELHARSMAAQAWEDCYQQTKDGIKIKSLFSVEVPKPINPYKL